ncbi:MAG: 23S rRNA (guanosine(2251)-2'-O)-methyltransferase RlmB, partial [Clostridia bacterium]|nr:23S rRNA (guanosine(2251)-2'-O)-methyltransferase RlmB [Clostridia bacterium]
MEKKQRNFTKGTYKNKFNRRPDSFQNGPAEEINECMISGRNAVRELLMGERDIDKIFVQRGEREGSITALIGMANERKIPIIEADKSKLDAMTGGTRHQGIVALAAEHNYS